MFLNMKNKLLALFDTITEMLMEIGRLSDKQDAADVCLAALGAILEQLDKEESPPKKSRELLLDIQAEFTEFYKDTSLINDISAGMLNKKVKLLKQTIAEEIKAKLNVVFFPYKASMWDSLESVYEAAVADPDCVATVVPIPYYQLTQDEEIPTYEGDKFPAHIPITHYNQYDLAQEEPDIIFVHNIYDQYNTITRVHEMYFTSNLKQYTSMLVYVPYHITSFVSPSEGERRMAYSIPTIVHVDKVILMNETLKQSAIKDGVPEEKILVLGSPKLDGMVKALQEEIPYPDEWKEKIKGKTVYVLNTGCLELVDNPFVKLERLTQFLSIPQMADNSVVIWRPHPLTKISIMKYASHLAGYYANLMDNLTKGSDSYYHNVILDESADYFPALKAADVLISSDGSLLRSYLLTEKKVLFWGTPLSERSLIPSDAFYYMFNPSEPWFELVKKFSRGYDPLADKRKGLASKAYVNTDGTSGKKIYAKIKESVLETNL